MRPRELIMRLREADGVEECAINALTQILTFYLARNFTFGMDEERIDEVRQILQTLKSDSEKHERLIQECRVIAEGVQHDL